MIVFSWLMILFITAATTTAAAAASIEEYEIVDGIESSCSTTPPQTRRRTIKVEIEYIMNVQQNTSNSQVDDILKNILDLDMQRLIVNQTAFYCDDDDRRRRLDCHRHLEEEEDEDSNSNDAVKSHCPESGMRPWSISSFPMEIRVNDSNCTKEEVWMGDDGDDSSSSLSSCHVVRGGVTYTFRDDDDDRRHLRSLNDNNKEEEEELFRADSLALLQSIIEGTQLQNSHPDIINLSYRGPITSTPPAAAAKGGGGGGGGGMKWYIILIILIILLFFLCYLLQKRKQVQLQHDENEKNTMQDVLSDHDADDDTATDHHLPPLHRRRQGPTDDQDDDNEIKTKALIINDLNQTIQSDTPTNSSSSSSSDNYDDYYETDPKNISLVNTTNVHICNSALCELCRDKNKLPSLSSSQKDETRVISFRQKQEIQKNLTSISFLTTNRMPSKDAEEFDEEYRREMDRVTKKKNKKKDDGHDGFVMEIDDEVGSADVNESGDMISTRSFT